MNDPSPSYETVFKSRQRGECMEARLVLDAVGIVAQAAHRDGWWYLNVGGADAADAAAELEDYRRENLDRSSEHAQAVPVYGGAGAGVLVYAMVIILVAVLSGQGTLGLDWQLAGRVQAGQVIAGQWWRTVTALTLHLDAEHLIANLAFGSVFGLLAGRVLGGGVAWLAIVIAGAMGNLINAVVQQPDHSSIGASTAVFAALGVIVSHGIRNWGASQERPLKRWSPLIGGVLLLAFTGVGGERTDVAAHLTGFLAGLAIGWVGCRFPHDWLASKEVQKWSGCLAVLIVTAAWIVAMVLAS